MSKALGVVGKIAGVIALIPSPIQPIAAAIAVVATTASQLTAKKPAAKGSATNIILANEAPFPCILGSTYTGGVLRYDNAWGGKVGKVQNPYRAMVIVYSLGPVNALTGRFADFEAITFSADAATGYYADYMWNDTQIGLRPEANQLQAEWASMPDWDSTSKLSGKAAILWSLKFDKDGKRYSGGVPQLGATWEGVPCYDPRLDTTYPGGSGAHRIDDEDTWEYTDNPALHAIAYIYGRYHDGKKMFGVGMPVDGIDLAAFVAWANVCEANGWVIGGVIYEPGDKWGNIKDICAAGSAEPCFAGGRISVKYDAPRVSLATITEDDIAEGAITVRAMQSYRDRLNTIVPKYRSADHKWEYVAATEVDVGTYITEDGEVRTEERQWNLVQNVDQVTQLAAYTLVNGRELAIDCTLKHDFRFYQPGDMLTFEIAEAGLEGVDAVMVSRTIDPGTLTVTAKFIGETAAKHAYALGLTGTPPPTPTLSTGEDADVATQINVTRPPFIETTAPSGTDIIDTDVWYDSDDNYKQYVRSGGAWVAVVADAAAANQTLAITAQVQTTGPIVIALSDGATTTIEASIKVDGLTGSVTQRLQVESREAGGTWAALGALESEAGGLGDSVAPYALRSLTNSTGVSKSYEVRAVTSTVGAGTGTIDPAQSFISATPPVGGSDIIDGGSPDSTYTTTIDGGAP